VSETILDHGYVPEEHAPDPVVGHGDPAAPGKIGIWLFLASEIMFFIGILGSYIILRSGSPEMFASHAAVLSKIAAGINTLVLIFSSLTMALAVDAAQKGQRNRLVVCLALTLLCAIGFMGIKYIEYTEKLGSPFGHALGHHTLVYNDPDSKQAFVYDGHVHDEGGGKWKIHGVRMKAPDQGLDIHTASEHSIEQSPGHEKGEWTLDRKGVGSTVTYGPWKSIFFSCYFALTGVHGLHVVGGIVPIGMLLIQAIRGRVFPAQTEYTGLYWHFVDLVWIFLFPLMYLI
jgi:cytochrome c oxidase subunit 3